MQFLIYKCQFINVLLHEQLFLLLFFIEMPHILVVVNNLIYMMNFLLVVQLDRFLLVNLLRLLQYLDLRLLLYIDLLGLY